MDTEVIDEIYKTSTNKYNDLYNFFFNSCKFEVLSTRLQLGFEIFRVRDYKKMSEIKTTKDVQHPPKAPTVFSRIGKPNDNWFYISDDYNTAITEMFPSWHSKLSNGQIIKIIISKWQIKKSINVIIIPDFDNINKVSKMLNLSSHYDDKEFWLYICKKFKTTTLEDKYIYEFTSAFANSLIDRANLNGKKIKGIFYPSVQYPLNSNIALLPSIVDSKKIILKDIYRTVIWKSWFKNKTKKPFYFRICKIKKTKMNI